MKRIRYRLAVAFGVVALIGLFLAGRAIVKNNMEQTEKLAHTGKGEDYFNGTVVEENEDYIIVKAYGKQSFFKDRMNIEVNKGTIKSDNLPSALEKGEKIRIVFNQASISKQDQTYRIGTVFGIYRISDIE